MILTIQSKSNAQTIVDLFNAIVAGEESEHQAQPLSIYDEHKHICSLVATDGTQILELIIERERGDVLIPAPLPEGEEAKEGEAWPRSKTKNKGK
jgi:hypothetical protein